MREEFLTNELKLIKNDEIRNFAYETLRNTPDYFYVGQASSTGKYHPKCTLREGGLLIHVKRAVHVANRLCDGWGVEGLDRDIVLCATLLHDIAKTGRDASYDDYLNHPINAKKYFADTLLNKEILMTIDDCIRYHMGLWTPASIKKPLDMYTLLELLVYTSDYIATTKTLETPVDNEDLSNKTECES